MKCNKCNQNPCGCGCGPAEYGCNFSVEPNPFDSSKVNINVNGATQSIKLPNRETDTKLSINTVDNTLNYSAERHSDTLTGTQLGSLVELKDLSDVRIDEGLDGNCYELVYHKYGNCGEGCVSPLDAWSNFNPFVEGGKQDYMHFVRGANAYGCPTYLDTPTNPEQYWFAGWKKTGEHKEFGYYQPEEVAELPKDASGNPIVLSLSPATKRPVVGPMPFQDVLNNIVAGLGMSVYGTFSIIQQTPNFGADFNSVTGDFVIHWSDWWNSDLSRHVGDGRITGRLNWKPAFNVNTGKMTYHVTDIYFNTMSFTTDQGFPTPQNVFITVKGVQLGTGAETTVVDRYEHHGNTNWSHTINQTIPCDYTIECAPGTTVGPINFAYILNDTSILDDEGYLQANFQNKLPGWEV